MLGSENPNECYDQITDKFLGVVNNYAPPEKKTLRRNDTPFINKELWKEICKCSRLRNKSCRNPAKDNEVAFKNQRNKCIFLRQRNLKNHLVNRAGKAIMTNKEFGNFTKPFLTSKGFLENNNITLIGKVRVKYLRKSIITMQT